MTEKCHALSQRFVQMKERDIFGYSDEDEPYFWAESDSNPESRDDDDDDLHPPSATDISCNYGLSMLTGSSDSAENLSHILGHDVQQFESNKYIL